MIGQRPQAPELANRAFERGDGSRVVSNLRQRAAQVEGGRSTTVQIAAGFVVLERALIGCRCVQGAPAQLQDQPLKRGDACHDHRIGRVLSLCPQTHEQLLRGRELARVGEREHRRFSRGRRRAGANLQDWLGGGKSLQVAAAGHQQTSQPRTQQRSFAAASWKAGQGRLEQAASALGIAASPEDPCLALRHPRDGIGITAGRAAVENFQRFVVAAQDGKRMRQGQPLRAARVAAAGGPRALSEMGHFTPRQPRLRVCHGLPEAARGPVSLSQCELDLSQARITYRQPPRGRAGHAPQGLVPRQSPPQRLLVRFTR